MTVSWNTKNQIYNLGILVEGHHQKLLEERLAFVPESHKRHGSPESCGYTHSSTTKHLFLGSFNSELLGYQSCLEFCDDEDKQGKRQFQTWGLFLPWVLDSSTCRQLTYSCHETDFPHVGLYPNGLKDSFKTYDQEHQKAC